MRRARKGAYGFFVTRFTVYSSSTSIRSTSATLARLGDFCPGSSTRWSVKRTASALNGSPLWKTTPRRSRSCQVRSSRSRHDSASAPTIFPPRRGPRGSRRGSLPPASAARREVHGGVEVLRRPRNSHAQLALSGGRPGQTPARPARHLKTSASAASPRAARTLTRGSFGPCPPPPGDACRARPGKHAAGGDDETHAAGLGDVHHAPRRRRLRGARGAGGPTPRARPPLRRERASSPGRAWGR